MKIFLSSTYEDLVAHRGTAALALERLGQQGVRMEVFGARPAQAVEACLAEIADSDALVGLYAHRYGFVPAGVDLSITEQEFDFALEQGKPVFAFLVQEDYPWIPRHIEPEPGRAHLAAFKDKLRNLRTCDSFTTPDDLGFKIASSLGRFLISTRIAETLNEMPGRNAVSTEQGRTQVVRRGVRLAPVIKGARLLLVNDVPRQMGAVIRILEELKIAVTVATTTPQALTLLHGQSFDVVVSDMERHGVPDDGLRLLRAMRLQGTSCPLIFTVGRYDPERGTPPHAFGITNRIDELLNLVFDALERVRG